jgi:glycosidase
MHVQGYLPSSLYTLDTPYGSKSDLIELVKALRNAGIHPIADIVINHRCADEQACPYKQSSCWVAGWDWQRACLLM